MSFLFRIRTEKLSYEADFSQRDWGQWAVYDTSPQSIIITFSYSLINCFGDYTEF